MPLITTGLDGEEHDSFQKQFQYDAYIIKPGFSLKKSTLIASPDSYDKLLLICKHTPTLNPIKKRSSNSVVPSSVSECLINSMPGIPGLAVTCFLRAAMHCADLIRLCRTIMSVLMPHIHAAFLPTSGPTTGQPGGERRRISVSAIRLIAHG